MTRMERGEQPHLRAHPPPSKHHYHPSPMLCHNTGRCGWSERKRMRHSPDDQAIVARLLPQLTSWSASQQRKHVTYDRQGRVCYLHLYELGLTRLIPEV